MFYFSTLFSATYTWNKPGGGVWNSSGNWTPASPAAGPPAGSDIIIPALTNSTKFIDNVPNITLNSITFSGAGASWLQASSSGNIVTISSSWYVPMSHTLTIGASGARLVWTLASTCTATLNGHCAFDAGNTNRNFTVNGTLIVNSSGCLYDPNPSGGSDFYLTNGATLKTQKSQGITTVSAPNSASINYNVAICFGGSYSYASGANYEYNGTSGQITGSGLSQNTPATLTVNLSAGSTLTLTSSTSLSGSLVLTSGILATSSTSLLTLLSTASAPVLNVGSLSYIDGPMRCQKNTSGVSTLNFPIGKSSDCRPIQLVVNQSSATLYNYTAELFNSSARALGYTLPLTVDTVSNVHYWDVARTNGAGVSQPTLNLTNATIKLNFGSNDGVKDLSTIRAVKNTYTATTVWSDLFSATSSGTPSNGNVTSSAFTSFSRFTLAGSAAGFNPLPISLIDFSSMCLLNGVQLKWSTATELDNDYFLIECSEDGYHWETIAKIQGKGNSNVVNNYIHTDYKNSSALIYYRLSQVDLNQIKNILKTIDVRCERTLKDEMILFPNPSSTELNILLQVNNPSSSNTIILTNDLGKIVFKEKVNLFEGLNSFVFPVEFESGTYNVFFSSNNNLITSQKLIVVKP